MNCLLQAPQGMKRNLNRIMEAWNPSSLPSSPIHMQALFVLVWFHAVVQVGFVWLFIVAPDCHLLLNRREEITFPKVG